ncbi:hypothetical protein KDL45_15440, partial [bacterium]|nr:hypothetical protein [bacterium]
DALKFAPNGDEYFLGFEQSEPTKLILGKSSGGSWQFETVPTQGVLSDEARYDFDRDSNPAVFYRVGNRFAGSLHLAQRVGGRWRTQELLESGEDAWDIDVDENKTIRLLLGSGNLVYVESAENGAWRYKMFENDSEIDSAKMLVDRDGHVYILWTRAYGAKLRLTTNVSGEWKTQKIEEAGSSAVAVTMAFDNVQRPVLYYNDVGGGYYYPFSRLTAAYPAADGSWSIAAIDGNDYFRTASVAIDSRGVQHLFYTFDSALMYMETSLPELIER